MTRFHMLARGHALAVAAALVFACSLTGLSTEGAAKKAKPAAAGNAAQPAAGPQRGQAPSDDDAEQKKQAAAAARQAYDAGLKAFANSKYQSAEELLSTALKGGGLAPTEMAKAFYTRGMAYKKQNKPGQAISDLTSALWLKNGLSGTDRETATAERSEAYKMAGIEDTGKGPERVVVSNPNVASAASAAPVPAAPPPGSIPTANASSAGLSDAAIAQAAASGPHAGTGSPGAVTRQDTTSEAAQDAARARASYASGDENGLQAVASSSVSAGGTAPPATSNSFSLAQPAEAAPTSTASSSPMSTITAVPSTVAGFFSNMFGGGTPAPAAGTTPVSNVTTASTSPSSAEPETSSWSSATVVSDHAAQKPSKHKTQMAAVEPPPAPVAAPSKPGKYKVHIAALRSRAEAEALAQKLVAEHGADLSNHAPTVDEAVIGSMGTFYRVRVGGYASQDEPRGLCNKLRTSGLDCLVVTN